MYKNAKHYSLNGRPDDALEGIIDIALEGTRQSSPLQLYALEGDKKNAFDIALDGELAGALDNAIEGVLEGISKDAPMSGI